MRISFVNKKKIYIIIINRELHKYIYIYTYGLCLWLLIGQSCTSHPPLGLSTNSAWLVANDSNNFVAPEERNLQRLVRWHPGILREWRMYFTGIEVTRWQGGTFDVKYYQGCICCVLSLQTSIFFFALQASVPALHWYFHLDICQEDWTHQGVAVHT